jgi:hypothetical protein
MFNRSKRTLLGLKFAATLALSWTWMACGGSNNGSDGGGDGDNRLCTTVEDCQDGERCFAGVCKPGDFCETKEDCPENFQCNLISQRCLQGECIEDKDCGLRKKCKDSICREQCGEVQCETGQVCDPETETCKPMPCTIGVAECGSNTDCLAGMTCDPVAHGCTECPSGFFCNMHQCFPAVTPCQTHTDCDVGQRCNPETNKCEPFPDSCDKDSQCSPKYCNLFTHVCQDDAFKGDCKNDDECHQAYGVDYYCHLRLHNCVLPLEEGQCYDTPDCQDSNLVCNLKNNTCAARGTVCGVDTDCNPGFVCRFSNCIFQCQSSCTDSWQCSGTDVCRNGCCMQDKSCYSAYDCTPPEQCIGGWCSPPLVCNDDSYEDNDNGTQAAVLPFPAKDVSDTYSNLNLCSDDEDWFAFDVPAGEDITVTMSFSDNNGDLDMQLFKDPAGSTWDLLGESTGSTDTEEISWSVVSANTRLYFRIYGYWGAQNVYTLKVTHGSNIIACSSNDVYEPNEDQNHAKQLVLPNPGPDTYNDLVICPLDKDWYSFALQANDALRARIEFTNSVGDLNLELHDSNGGRIDESDGTANFEEVQLPFAATAGNYYVRVGGWMDQSSPYSLKVWYFPQGVDPSCVDDGVEPNDRFQDATLLSSIARDMSLCGANRDWYKIQVAAGERIRVNAAYDAAQGSDLSLELYDGSGTTKLNSRDGSDGNADVVAQSAGAGLLYLKAFLSHPQPGFRDTYSLTLNRLASDCTDGGLEPNETSAAAKTLSTGEHTGLFICVKNQGQPDVDWYKISVAQGMHLTVGMDHLGSDGFLGGTLYEPDGITEIDSTFLNRDHEELYASTTNQAKTFLLKMESDKPAIDISYRVSVTIQ